jgi:ABC-type Na+ transport system ATPase subunit NatA
MNAAIHGLTDQQVRDRFDAIVEFAEIGEFIDMPVRTYSSGMQLRLAFGVAGGEMSFVIHSPYENKIQIRAVQRVSSFLVFLA